MLPNFEPLQKKRAKTKENEKETYGQVQMPIPNPTNQKFI